MITWKMTTSVFPGAALYSLPREFWYDNGLRMAPAAELERPAVQCTSLSGGTVQAGNFPLSVKNGQSFRLKAEIDPLNATHIGFTVRGDASTAEYTALYCGYSRENSLIMDTTHSGLPGPHDMRGGLLFYLPLGKRFPWIFFVDKSVVEIFVNDRQAICRRFLSLQPPCSRQRICRFGRRLITALYSVWEMMPANPY